MLRRIDGDFYDSEYQYINSDKALEILSNYDNLVFKISIGSAHGKGVSLVNKSEYDKKIGEYGNNYIVQEKIEQHENLAKFNASSVNILRITSLYWKENVYILGSILRVGAPGSFCDHTGYKNTTPRIVKVDDSGNIVGKAISPDDGFIYNDLFGKEITGTIPKYKNIIDTIKHEHLKFTHHKIIGWDITVNSDNEPICLEFNTYCPGVVQTQMVCGSIFSKKLVKENVF